MKKLFRSRRGLSTVISTILMIMVVMVGMSLLFAYVAFYSQNYKAGIGSSVLESIVIEDVWFRDSTHVYIAVYNVGKIDCEINGIYANGIALKDNSTQATNLNIDIPIGERHTFTLTSTNEWSLSTYNNLKISTVRGSYFEGDYRYPSEVI